MKERTAANAKRTKASGEARPLALFPPGAEVVELAAVVEEVFEGDVEPSSRQQDALSETRRSGLGDTHSSLMGC